MKKKWETTWNNTNNQGRPLETFTTNIRLLYSDEKGKYPAWFICRKDKMCELSYQVKEKVKGIIFIYLESHLYTVTIPSNGLDCDCSPR